MGNEDDTGDQEDQEIFRRKEGSGQIPSGTNPRGAGRPTKEWLEFKREQTEFQAWKEAKARGEFASSATISERLDRFIEGRGKGDSEGQPKGFVEGALKRLNLDKWFGDLKFDKVEELLYKGWGVVAPYVIPIVAGFIAMIGIMTVWYVAEEVDKTDEYSYEDWLALAKNVRDSYHTVNQPIARLLTGEETGLKVKAVRKMFPQILHGFLKFVEWFTGMINQWQEWIGIDNFLPYKLQSMYSYHMLKYFRKLRSLFGDIFDK